MPLNARYKRDNPMRLQVSQEAHPPHQLALHRRVSQQALEAHLPHRLALHHRVSQEALEAHPPH